MNSERRIVHTAKRGQQGGFVLVYVSLLVTMLVIFAASIAAHALTDVRSAQRSSASVQALYLAEAGIDQALFQLRQDYNWETGWTNVALGSGTYSVTVDALGGERRLTAQGASQALGTPVVRMVEAIVRQNIPPNFFDYVIWAAEELDLNGNSFSVTGDVMHADTSPEGNLSQVEGTVTYDAKASPLPRFKFQTLYDIASAQNNVYTEEELGNGHGIFPSSFWYSEPTDPGDSTTGVPNVHYILGDLVLNGNIGTIGGFFVVVGDVLTDPTAVQDSTINGNGQIAGAIYTTGDFRVNGGGNGLNVDGGVWAGDEARLNGNVTMTYNETYMKALQALDLEADVQLISWRDL